MHLFRCKKSLVALATLFPLALAQTAAPWDQCGGLTWNGATTCVSGYVCQYYNDYYSQCIPITVGTTTWDCFPTTAESCIHPTTTTDTTTRDCFPTTAESCIHPTTTQSPSVDCTTYFAVADPTPYVATSTACESVESTYTCTLFITTIMPSPYTISSSSCTTYTSLSSTTVISDCFPYTDCDDPRYSSTSSPSSTTIISDCFPYTDCDDPRYSSTTITSNCFPYIDCDDLRYSTTTMTTTLSATITAAQDASAI